MSKPSHSREAAEGSPQDTSHEISAWADDTRERLRSRFDRFRVGIEEIRSGDSNRGGSFFAVSADGGGDAEDPGVAVSVRAEHAREQMRDEFQQLRGGIERSLKGLEKGNLSP